MTDAPKASEKVLREQRLEAALRENLRRRKTQARGRAEQERPPHDSAGIGAEDNT
jgi:hypothetical protein